MPGVWLTPAPGGGSGGGGGDYTLIETVTLESDTATISFSSIPATYKSLVFRGRLRSDDTDTTDILGIRMGGGAVDSGATDYYYHYNWEGGDAGTNDVDSDGANIALLGVFAGGASTGFSYIEGSIYDYATSNDHLGLVRIAGVWDSTRYRHYQGTFEHQGTEAIDIVTFLPQQGSNFEAGSELTLYGVG